MMAVLQPLADVFKHRPRFEVRGSRFEVRGCLGFVNLVNPIRSHPIDHTPLPVAPPHFNAHRIGQTPRGKHPHRIITAQVSAPADHLLALHRNRPAVEPNPGPDTLRVGRLTLQPYRHTRRRGLIPIHPGHRVEIIHHDIQVAVPVQVRQRHSSGVARGVKAPRGAHFFKGQIPSVMEGHLGHLQTRKLKELLGNQLAPPWTHRANACLGV